MTITSLSGPPDYSAAARRLLFGARHKGLAIHPMLLLAGICPSWEGGSGQPLRGIQFLRLLQAVKETTEDEFFALTPRRCKPGTFAMMASTGLHCDTLRAHIEHCCQFYYLVSDDICLDFRESGHSASLVVTQHEPAFDPDQFLSEFLLLNLHRSFSWITGFMLPLQAVEFSADEEPSADRLLYYLRGDWRTRAADNRFTFHSKYLGLPLVRTRTELETHLRDGARDKPIWPQDHQSWSAMVRARLKTALYQHDRLEGLEDIAAGLHLTSRTLRRHLSDEGASYQQILDELRRDFAIEKLHLQHLTVAEVAELLGFSEPRSFSRAFKQWTGTTPGKYQPRF